MIKVIIKIVILKIFFFSFSVNATGTIPNNTWYTEGDQDTVFVFVHGIFSNASSAWNYDNLVFWPELVKIDSSLGSPDIFLGGYTTTFDSGAFNIRAASNSLFRQLSVNKSVTGETVMSKKNLVFVAHSMGGIVVRHFLVENREAFRQKNVGLMLFASPSIGSKVATRLNWLANFFDNRMGDELQWDHPFLTHLDKSFKNLINESKLECISGAEAVENHLIVSKLFGLLKEKTIVEEESAGRYFGEPQIMEDTDHFSIVKPDSQNHPSHIFLRYFYNEIYDHDCEIDPSVLGSKYSDAASEVARISGLTKLLANIVEDAQGAQYSEAQASLRRGKLLELLSKLTDVYDVGNGARITIWEHRIRYYTAFLENDVPEMKRVARLMLGYLENSGQLSLDELNEDELATFIEIKEGLSQEGMSESVADFLNGGLFDISPDINTVINMDSSFDRIFWSNLTKRGSATLMDLISSIESSFPEVESYLIGRPEYINLLDNLRKRKAVLLELSTLEPPKTTEELEEIAEIISGFRQIREDLGKLINQIGGSL